MCCILLCILPLYYVSCWLVAQKLVMSGTVHIDICWTWYLHNFFCTLQHETSLRQYDTTGATEGYALKDT